MWLFLWTFFQCIQFIANYKSPEEPRAKAKQECIPVGCVPIARWPYLGVSRRRRGGGVSGQVGVWPSRSPLTRHLHPFPLRTELQTPVKTLPPPHCSVWKSVHPYLPGAKANCLLILAPLFYVNAKSIIAFILFSGHNHTKRKWARKIAFLKKMQVSKIIYSIQVSCLLNTTLPEVWGNGSFPVIVMLINEAWNDLKTLIRVCGSFPRTTLVVTTKSFSSPSAQG